MCTFIMYHDPSAEQPLVMASVRNERLERQTLLPASATWDTEAAYQEGLRHSKGRLYLHRSSGFNDFSPYIKAGIKAAQDERSNSTFAGINKHGLVATVNNLDLPLDNSNNKLTRGGLVLDALTYDTAEKAANRIYSQLIEIQRDGTSGDNPNMRYPSLSMIIADKDNAYIIHNQPAVMESPPRLSDAPDARVSKTITPAGGFEGDKITVTKEHIPPRTPVMICGWGINDSRSERTNRFLPIFQRIAENSKNIPDPDKPATWAAWLSCMMIPQISSGSESGDPHDGYISQRPYLRFSPDGREKKWCATLSTGLFSIHKDASGNGVADFLFSPSPPNTEKPMEFQAVSSDPKRFPSARSEWDATYIPHKNFALNLTAEARPTPDSNLMRYFVTAKELPIDHAPNRFIPDEADIDLSMETVFGDKTIGERSNDTQIPDTTISETTLKPRKKQPDTNIDPPKTG